MKRTRTEVIRVAIAAVLMCLYVILNRFVSVYLPLGGLPSVRIGFSSIPIVLASLLCGPIWGGLAGAGGDLIGAFAFPNGTGAYLYGYTIDQALLGIIPWVLYRIFRGHRKSLMVFDGIVTLGALGVFCGLVIPSGSSDRYQIPLSLGGRIGLGIGMAALIAAMNLLTWFLSRRIFGGERGLSDAVICRVRDLAKALSERELMARIRSDARCLIRSNLSVCARYEIDDISKAREIGWSLWFACLTRGSLRSLLRGSSRGSPAYSFLEIYSILLFEMVMVKTLLLAFWGQLYFSIPYAYGVFGDLIAGVITLPILAVLTYAILLPLHYSGIQDRFNGRRSYR